uniref:hypothetical protein n=1 Tax=Lachnoclostridium phocaeense TaxID=1871021 RepID=UPI0026DC8928|nr:hypothetical protein [Lachnoclostridium phocaeense]
MRRKAMVTITLMLMMYMISACGLKSGLEEYKLPDSTENTPVNEATISVIKRAAEKAHTAPALSDDFVDKYLDIDSMLELEKRVETGLAAANDVADLTEAEFQAWSDIIESKQLNMYTTSDIEQRKSEIYEVLNGFAAKADQSFEEYMKKAYGMDPAEAEAFAKKQAQKFVDEQ